MKEKPAQISCRNSSAQKVSFAACGEPLRMSGCSNASVRDTRYSVHVILGGLVMDRLILNWRSPVPPRYGGDGGGIERGRERERWCFGHFSDAQRKLWGFPELIYSPAAMLRHLGAPKGLSRHLLMIDYKIIFNASQDFLPLSAQTSGPAASSFILR